MAIITHKKKKDTARLSALKRKIIDPKTVHTVNFLMDAKLHRRLKTKALANEETMTEIFIRAAEEYLR